MGLGDEEEEEGEEEGEDELEDAKDLQDPIPSGKWPQTRVERQKAEGGEERGREATGDDIEVWDSGEESRSGQELIK